MSKQHDFLLVTLKKSFFQMWWWKPYYQAPMTIGMVETYVNKRAGRDIDLPSNWYKMDFNELDKYAQETTDE